MLRDYQSRSIHMLYSWFERNRDGHPCLVMPTGSGKSHVIAEVCRHAVQSWPETRILMLTHVRELIEQNATKMRAAWPNAPLGIYSAGLRQRVLHEPITFAGIQSVSNKAEQIGHVDLVIIDECHLISTKQQGRYRKLIDDLQRINPRLRLIGFTATPWRLGEGRIVDGETALFTDLIEPVTIEELVYKGFLAPLRSKHTDTQLSTEGVHKRGGEFVAGELERAVDTYDTNQDVAAEIIRRAEERKAWLIFCAGVDHALHMRNVLQENDVNAECITGKTPRVERDRIIGAFRSGEIRALTNANVLSTGFDYPDIDLIAMVRPTLSPSLYVQMAGRGMRPKSHTDHCRVLDFAGNVDRHGPITAVQPLVAKGNGEAPIKVCPECDEVVHLSAKHCPECGHEFVFEDKPEPVKLHDADIMGLDNNRMEVAEWQWHAHVSRSSGKEMVRVTYYPESLSGEPITEYFPITHTGYAGQMAVTRIAEIACHAGIQLPSTQLEMSEVAEILNQGRAPVEIHYKRDGKFYRVINRSWQHAETYDTTNFA